MDLAGEYLTVHGRSFIMKALARKGVGQINYISWKWGYIYHCNQLAAFNYGRVASYLLFEQHWGHVKPYTKIAMDNLDEAMRHSFSENGGYLESPNYLEYTLYCAQRSYLVYANMRNKKLSEVVPECMKKSGNFAQAIISTSKRPGHQIIPFGQSAKWTIATAFIAAMAPDSAWVNIMDKSKTPRRDYGNVYSWIFLRMVPREHVKLKPFILLDKAGLVSSLRYYKKQAVKILFLGFNDKVGKRNEDIGSFVLEFAGNTFFMDPPVYRSKNGWHSACQWHNMLVPYGKKEYHPMFFTKLWGPLAKRMAPKDCSGDEKSFYAKVNVGRSWNKGIRKHIREINSPSPNIVKIIDTYKLRNKAEGVNFYLQTYLPVEIKNNTIIVNGEFGGQAEIAIPAGCKATLEKYSLQRVKGQCTRICISKPGKSGTLETIIRLNYDNKNKIR